ncbi:hypothetical protein AMAG_06732 [Allomyces macrogynus ATCC 38327]|uniref:Uncharacterized protein n=1 Tax=Allomyces macrogynus (strain ATCC 38327) TaxID=578462 RepID=A0A0L0SES1_ALLM3|nr:hypothetical protein AMAG_06732 [Allomyces macrogynus ATCC 38327]|eukprot:KNE60971.1 hypothetical protein AMAG_06732 [Allomyces macrogynus ATCC 38327]
MEGESGPTHLLAFCVCRRWPGRLAHQPPSSRDSRILSRRARRLHHALHLAYTKMDPGQPWDPSMERLMLSSLIIGCDAMIDLVCTVVVFILVLRIRMASRECVGRTNRSAKTAASSRC